LDRVVGLEIGADDYVVKPFSPREVAARVKAILKRVRPIVAATESLLPSERSREFVIDLERKTIHYQQQLLQLTRFEFCLLQALIEQPGRVFSRDQLLSAVGVTADAGYDRSIDGHIKTLRAKLRAVNTAADPIKTQRGFGYSYQPELQ
jgi:two-component system catabolic regulation response regulator CreB